MNNTTTNAYWLALLSSAAYEGMISEAVDAATNALADALGISMDDVRAEWGKMEK